jgi:hypothetical protein
MQTEMLAGPKNWGPFRWMISATFFRSGSASAEKADEASEGAGFQGVDPPFVGGYDCCAQFYGQGQVEAVVDCTLGGDGDLQGWSEQIGAVVNLQGHG